MSFKYEWFRVENDPLLEITFLGLALANISVSVWLKLFGIQNIKKKGFIIHRFKVPNETVYEVP